MKIDKLTGRVLRERARFEGDPHDTVIATVLVGDEEQSVKVREDDWGLALRCDYTFWGNWTRYKNKTSGMMERQFAAFAYYHAEETQLVEDLMGLLLGRKFPRDLATRCVYEWGDRAREIIERSPYLLMKFPRCGWKLTDDLYLSLGKPKDALKRQTLCAAYDLSTNSDGSIWHPMSRVENVIGRSVTNASPVKAVKLGKRSGMLEVRRTLGHDGPLHWDGDFEWVATSVEARWESRLAELLSQRLLMPPSWPGIPRGDMSEHQHEQLTHALSSPIGLLLGSAGTGKTYTAAQVIRSIDPTRIVAISAPTGKAAVRLTEAMSELGVKHRCVTNHSLLGYNGSSYTYDEQKPLDIDYLFVDEGSMIDLEMMCRLLRATPPGCQTLILGDPYQLPPVGPGAPLRDMATLLPTGELTEVRRNAGAIVLAGQRIRLGQSFDVHDDYEPPEKNLVLRVAQTPDQQIRDMLSCYDFAINHLGLDPLWDVQVLCVVKKDSPCGTHEINKLLQRHLNASAPEVRGTPFRVGDKVMQTQNGWMIPVRAKQFNRFVPDCDPGAVMNKSGQVYVANGEMGRVVSVDDKLMTIEMIQPRRKVIAFRGEVEEGGEAGLTGSSFDLAYAITTHKSQGSQFRVAICMLDEYPGARRMFDRSLLYTMITRAKDCTVLVGKHSTADAAVKRASIWQRKTFLCELFQQKAGKEATV
jgi:exodeoxyribonuclease V alpha subunit